MALMVVYTLRLVKRVNVNEREDAYEEGEALVGVCVVVVVVAADVIVGRAVGVTEWRVA